MARTCDYCGQSVNNHMAGCPTQDPKDRVSKNPGRPRGERKLPKPCGFTSQREAKATEDFDAHFHVCGEYGLHKSHLCTFCSARFSK